ncbi:hypothetical protein LguiA_006542 [Lonicera macranthoides]
MGTEDNGDMGFANRVGDGIIKCPSSVMDTNVAMSSGSMFKSSNGANPFFGSAWDPLVSLSQSENFGGSSSIPRNEFTNPPYPAVLENHQAINSFSHLVHYQSDSGLGEMVPKLPFLGSGRFSEMVGSFGLSDCGQITSNACPQNYPQNIEKASKNGTNSEEGGSPGGKKKRRASEKNGEGEEQKNTSEASSEQDEKKQKIEQHVSPNLRGKQTGKQTKDNSDSGEGPKENYIHVRAKRGQATNSHSLAERVRRERISERMRLLQELVPGCNKITGKAVMLDEIINYVQSLQQQVEFLSMKLATVNPELNVDMERILSKDILHSRVSNASVLGFGPGLSSPHPYSQGITQGSLPGIPSTIPPYHPLPQIVWDNELQTLLQMGFDSSPAVENMGPNGRSKPDL